jgi:RHS repeat-associated protein
MQHWVKYSAYGIPFGLPGADTDSDGDCDSTDVTQVQTWIDGPTYNVLGDIDLDGDVDATDKSTIQSSFEGDTGGWGVLSPSGVGHRRGFCGYQSLGSGGALYAVRTRVYSSGLGIWISRDWSEYADSLDLYLYAAASPVSLLDWSGLLSSSTAPAPVDPFDAWLRDCLKQARRNRDDCLERAGWDPVEILICLIYYRWERADCYDGPGGPHPPIPPPWWYPFYRTFDWVRWHIGGMHSPMPQTGPQAAPSAGLLLIGTIALVGVIIAFA